MTTDTAAPRAAPLELAAACAKVPIAGGSWTIFGPPVRGRSCGACTMCCQQVPVELPDGYKPANTRCRYQFSRGCRIYARRPEPCLAWSCRWLMDPDTADMRRPDLAGYAIDPMLDSVLVDGQPADIVQVWCDPGRRDAHRDPALRRYLAVVAARHGIAALVRWSSNEAMALIAPCLNNTGAWLEHESEVNQDAARKVGRFERSAGAQLRGARPRE